MIRPTDPTLSILFAGSGEFGLPTLEALSARHRLVHVYTQPDRPAGRGKKLTPTPVAGWCDARGVAVTRTDDFNAIALPPADALVVIAFGQKIGPHQTTHARLGAMNLHASRLPKYRGAAPIHWAILSGETVAGNSVIRLAEKMDAGAILGQSLVDIGETETTGELHDRLAKDGAPLVLGILADLAARRAVEREQDHAQATLAKKLGRTDALLDFARPAAEVAARINGLSPWPGCRVRVLSADGPHPRETDRLTLLRARRAQSMGPASHAMPPGTLVAGPSPLITCAADSLVEVIDVVPQGKRPMPLAAYRNGKPWDVGMRLEAVE